MFTHAPPSTSVTGSLESDDEDTEQGESSAEEDEEIMEEDDEIAKLDVLSTLHIMDSPD